MRNLGKLIVAKGFKKLPKVQKIARSGHTACGQRTSRPSNYLSCCFSWNFCFIKSLSTHICISSAYLSFSKYPLRCRLGSRYRNNPIFYTKSMWKMSIQYVTLGFKPTTFRTWVVTHNHYRSCYLKWAIRGIFLAYFYNFQAIFEQLKLFNSEVFELVPTDADLLTTTAAQDGLNCCLIVVGSCVTHFHNLTRYGLHQKQQWG